MTATQRQSRKIHFTKRNIEQLKPQDPDAPAREIEWSDDQAIGLKCLCNKANPPRKTFLFRGVFKKRKIAIALGTFPSISVDEARDKVYEYRKMISQGIDPLSERERQNKDLTFSEFSEIYLKHAESVNKSFKSIENMLRNQVLPVFNRYMLSAITKRDIQKFLDDVMARGRTGSTVNRYRSLFLRMFSLAVQWDYLSESPVRGKSLIRHKESPGRDVFLTEEETRRFLVALDEVPERISACALKLLTLTGKRHGETLSMKWSDVSFDEDIIYLRSEMTKAKRADKIFLSKHAKAILKELWELKVKGNPYVFPGKKPNTHLTACKRTFDRAKSLAGITKEGVNIHTLRHSFASNMLATGASLFEVSKMLNHSDMKITQRSCLFSVSCG